MSKSSAMDTTLTLTPSESKQALKHAAVTKSPVFVWGPPGIGKSQIMKQIAEELGMEFVDIRLSQMDPTDLRGIPYPGTDEAGNSVMYWSPPHFYQRDPNKPTFYLFDEMNAAPQSIQAAAYQIVLDRQLGDYKLNDGDVVFAAGNRDTDKGSTFKMPTPLMNRFTHLEMETSFDDFQEHAILAGFHKTVVGYLTWQKQDLFNFEPTSAFRGFPTPRSWERVSKLVHDQPDLSEKVRLALIAGAVGEGVAAKFIEYQKMNDALPNPTDILYGKITTLNKDQKETSICYALTIGLCYEMRDIHNAGKEAGKDSDEWSKWVEVNDNFLAFMMDNMQPEIAILGMRTILSTFKLTPDAKRLKNWKRFSSQYGELILHN